MGWQEVRMVGNIVKEMGEKGTKSGCFVGMGRMWMQLLKGVTGRNLGEGARGEGQKGNW